jgi:hypothetical protein
MSDTDELDAWLDANAALLGIAIAPEWRDTVRLHLRITRDMAQHVMDFQRRMMIRRRCSAHDRRMVFRRRDRPLSWR